MARGQPRHRAVIPADFALRKLTAIAALYLPAARSFITRRRFNPKNITCHGTILFPADTLARPFIVAGQPQNAQQVVLDGV
jgi:hypothetical protein